MFTVHSSRQETNGLDTSAFRFPFIEDENDLCQLSRSQLEPQTKVLHRTMPKDVKLDQSMKEKGTESKKARRSSTDEDEDEGTESKESRNLTETFVAVIAQGILSVPSKRMTLSSIYSFIAKTFPHFDKEKGPGWRNSVRHNLSSNDCFVKASRAENGKGHYWMIHPKDLPEFAKGNFRRRRKPRRPKCSHPLMFRESPFLYHSFTPSFSTFPYTAHLRSAPGDLPAELPVPLPYGSSERTLSPAFRPRLGLLPAGYDDSRTLSTVSHPFTYPTSALRFTETSSSRSLPPASGLTNFHGSFHYPCACHR